MHLYSQTKDIFVNIFQRGTQIQPVEVDSGNLCQIVSVYPVSMISVIQSVNKDLSSV